LFSHPQDNHFVISVCNLAAVSVAVKRRDFKEMHRFHEDSLFAILEWAVEVAVDVDR
jgi:hypothetical protein